jgi:hypothetical protein
VGAFLATWPLAGGRRWRVVSAGASGQPAFGHYIWDDARGGFAAHSITVLTLAAAQIGGITAFIVPGAFGRFGLADQIEP